MIIGDRKMVFAMVTGRRGVNVVGLDDAWKGQQTFNMLKTFGHDRREIFSNDHDATTRR